MQNHLARRRHLLATVALWPLCAGAAAPGKVWRVGTGQPISRIADALQRAADGDTIEILPGTYRGDVAVIRQRRLRLVGLVGSGQPRPRLEAAGQHAEGKAIWVVRDGDIDIENLDFDGCRVPDGNGAAIRLERGRLSLRQCGFSNHQIGLLTGNEAAAELTVEQCHFSRAPINHLDLSHLVYVGRIGRFSMQGCHLSQGLEGHLLKSRARRSIITGNTFDDGQSGAASYEIDLPDGGDAWVEGNTVVQAASSRNPVMLSYGAEGAPWPLNQLTLLRNTFINHLPSGGWFVRVWADRLPGGVSVRSEGNRYLGPGALLLGPGAQTADDQRGPLP